MAYEIELACDQHEAEQFAAWLRRRGHTVKIGRTTGSRLSGMPTEDPNEINAEFADLWARYCADSAGFEPLF